MAAIVRRIFEDLRNEHRIRVGRAGDTNYTTRAEHFVTGAYLDFCHTYHHFELDTLSTVLVCSTSAATLTLPTDCDVVMALTLRAVSGGTHLKTMVPVRSSSVFAELNSVSGEPRQFARHGGLLYFDRIPDALYPTTLYYYKLPADPDFANGTVVAPRVSALKWVWDERILELSVARAKNAHWLPELANPDVQTMKDFLSQAPEALIAHALLLERGQQRGDEVAPGGSLG